ncbi:MAG TPA: enoyl-CoA hydratase-related protein [Streptosporangiaceae bacterium]
MTARIDQDGPLVTITIDRERKLNALDYPTIDALLAALDHVEADDSIRAVVLTGAGSKAFSAGANIPSLAASIAGGPERAIREIVRRGHALTRRIEEFAKPVIVAVNDLAYGGGCEITQAASLAIAAEHATFAKPEITLGFPPPFGGSQRLPRHVGRKRALEMILCGDPITATRAAEIGLVNAVVPADELPPPPGTWPPGSSGTRRPPWRPACAQSPGASTCPLTRDSRSRRPALPPSSPPTACGTDCADSSTANLTRLIPGATPTLILSEMPVPAVALVGRDEGVAAGSRPLGGSPVNGPPQSPSTSARTWLECFGTDS